MRAGRPADDEYEVTLLGRGVGESCVVHLGQQQWMIVDSFFDSELREPAAKVYLDEIGVGRHEVEFVVLTHLDRDHYLGIAQLHDYYTTASLMLPASCNTQNLSKLYGDLDTELGGVPGAIASAERRKVPDGRPSLAFLQDMTDVRDPHGGGRVRALAPTAQAVAAARNEIGQALRTGDLAAVVSKLKNDNRTSVVLHALLGDRAALLGGDLLNEPSAFGWPEVVRATAGRALAKADLVKVPHHGSKGAHHDDAWQALVVQQPVMLVAPFWNQGLPLPRDVDRLLGLGPDVWQAAPSRRDSTPSVVHTVRVSPAPGRTGRVTARWSRRTASWTVHQDGVGSLAVAANTPAPPAEAGTRSGYAGRSGGGARQPPTR